MTISRPLLLLALGLVGCASPAPRTTGPAEAPVVERGPAGPDTSPRRCEDPRAAFATHGWLPNDVHWAARVRLDAPRLPAELTILEASPLASVTARNFATRMQAELPALLRLSREIGLESPEAVYFVAGSDIGVWAVPTSCEASEHTRFAANLGLAVRATDEVSSVAVDGPSGRSSLQFASGQMWITDASRTPELLRWLANVAGARPDREGVTGMLGLQLRETPREVTLQVWSNTPDDPYTVDGLRVDGDQLHTGTVRYAFPTQISPN